jgi:hypothetical protein
MIKIDKSETENTYVCPYCELRQIFNSNNDDVTSVGFHRYVSGQEPKYALTNYDIHHIKCTNKACGKISVVALHRDYNAVLAKGTNWLGVPIMKQIDLVPTFTCRHFPDYVPAQIRNDYTEGVGIIDLSPKAAATMFRRSLQGMIRDFWEIKVQSKILYDEINAIKTRVSASQWKAIDGVRKIGNIGAHMEMNVNIIVDVEPNEAQKLQQLIELLIEKWYVARHDEEALCKAIDEISAEKDEQKHAKERT